MASTTGDVNPPRLDLVTCGRAMWSKPSHISLTGGQRPV